MQDGGAQGHAAGDCTCSTRVEVADASSRAQAVAIGDDDSRDKVIVTST